MLDYATRHRMAMRGHTLLWHRPKWMPAWAESHDFGSAPAKEAERLLTTHIETVMRHCGPRIASWDVVNEAVDPETGGLIRSEEHTSELQSLMRISYAVFCLK